MLSKDQAAVAMAARMHYGYVGVVGKDATTHRIFAYGHTPQAIVQLARHSSWEDELRVFDSATGEQVHGML